VGFLGLGEEWRSPGSRHIYRPSPGPSVSFGSSSFGKITSQANFSRQLQLAMRFSF
jgi:hypothetical protein